ncbi:MAG: hypothetical protein LBF22_01375 [Deltaproteobacteria bacterium]|jgi:nicotinamide-nucleotide amidase|nr:hypothetical protein [Deltaproteobacteria bacterium]
MTDKPAPLKATLISTGTEITLGKFPDTNCAYLSRELSNLGIRVITHTSVPDDLGLLTTALKRARQEAEISILTGGLGPTRDDLTRLAAAQSYGVPLEFSFPLSQEIRAFMQGRGYPIPANNFRQAFLPMGATVIHNPLGTAPAFYFKTPEHLAIFLPGVPVEMEFLAQNSVIPLLQEFFPERTGSYLNFSFSILGLGEGRVDEILSDLISEGQNPEVGLSAKPFETRVLITARGNTQEEALKVAEPTLKAIAIRLKNHTILENQSLIEAVVNEISQKRHSLGVVDAVTSGELSLLFLSHLSPENQAAIILTSDPHQTGAEEFLFTQGASLVLCLTANPNKKYRSRKTQSEDYSATKVNQSSPIQQLICQTKILHNPYKFKRNTASPYLPQDFFQLTPLMGPAHSIQEMAAKLALSQLYSFLRGSK